MNSYSIYLHIPFCLHRCGYFDFNTYAGLEDRIPDYVQALCREIRLGTQQASERLPVHTVFFGGGTPSLLPAAEVERILQAIDEGVYLLPETEITLEANPGSLSLSYLKDLHQLGINRISLGVQSAHPGELRLLERRHDYPDVVRSVAWARQAGFDNLNLDLIFGLPHQALDSWQNTLRLAAGLVPEHFSLYALTLEHGTPMAHWTARGLLTEPDPDLAADMYEWASEYLVLRGYQQYEISNWASERNGEILACRHNLQYWRNQPYLGFGAGAHGYAASVRTANVLAPAAYIQRCLAGEAQPFPRTPATATALPVDQQAEIGETMMMGLRLVQEGVSDRRFQERFGRSLVDVFSWEIETCIQLGLLEWAGGSEQVLRLTRQGRLLGNQVFYRFL